MLNKRNKGVYFRLTPEIRDYIDKMILNNPGLTMSEFVRDCINKEMKKSNGKY